MKISVIIPAYLQSHKDAEMLYGLLDLEYRMDKNKHEIIVVNDGSPVEPLAASGITIMQKENGGVASARNLGLDVARGDFVVFVDADDKVADNFFELLDEAAKEDADICYFKVACEDGSVAYREPCAWGKLVKRSYIGDRRFDENQLIGEEDTLFLPLQKEKPPKKIYKDAILYYYRWSANPDSLMKRFWRGEIKKRKDEE